MISTSSTTALTQQSFDCGFTLSESGGSCRIGTHAFRLHRDRILELQLLGDALYDFAVTSNELYLASCSGSQPQFVSNYLDKGKPPELLRHARAKRIKYQVGCVIRPDVIPTANGFIIAEVDSVPGGIGLTGKLSEVYAGRLRGKPLASVSAGFAAMLSNLATTSMPTVAIVVSEESASYRDEMKWLARQLPKYGITAFVVSPEELDYESDAVMVHGVRVDVVYRFFELFDLPNIKNADRLMAIAERKKVVITPPMRTMTEEKMSFAFLHHPSLKKFWEEKLRPEHRELLMRVLPKTWVLDPADMPGQCCIPDLHVKGSAINSWASLKDLGRESRKYVIKPSGFSPLAWGSRGVVVGHDMSVGAWNTAIDNALKSFEDTPHILQEFHQGRRFVVRYLNAERGTESEMPCRVRLCPYYFVANGKVQMTSVLATAVPLDKKKIHGMSEAVMIPCEVV